VCSTSYRLPSCRSGPSATNLSLRRCAPRARCMVEQLLPPHSNSCASVSGSLPKFPDQYPLVMAGRASKSDGTASNLPVQSATSLHPSSLPDLPRPVFRPIRLLYMPPFFCGHCSCHFRIMLCQSGTVPSHTDISSLHVFNSCQMDW